MGSLKSWNRSTTFFLFSFSFFFWEIRYRDFFKYLIIFSSVCSFYISHTPSYYREKFRECGSKILIRDFEPKTLWISWGHYLFIKGDGKTLKWKWGTLTSCKALKDIPLPHEFPTHNVCFYGNLVGLFLLYF